MFDVRSNPRHATSHRVRESRKNEDGQLCSIERFWDDDERDKWVGDVSKSRLPGLSILHDGCGGRNKATEIRTAFTDGVLISAQAQPTAFLCMSNNPPKVERFQPGTRYIGYVYTRDPEKRCERNW